MERVGTLIQKLQQQLNENAGADQLLLTVQMLHAELISKKSPAAPPNSDKVVIIMPPVFYAVGENNANNNVEIINTVEAMAAEEKIVEVLQVDEKEIEEEYRHMLIMGDIVIPEQKEERLLKKIF